MVNVYVTVKAAMEKDGEDGFVRTLDLVNAGLKAGDLDSFVLCLEDTITQGTPKMVRMLMNLPYFQEDHPKASKDFVQVVEHGLIRASESLRTDMVDVLLGYQTSMNRIVNPGIWDAPTKALAGVFTVVCSSAPNNHLYDRAANVAKALTEHGADLDQLKTRHAAHASVGSEGDDLLAQGRVNVFLQRLENRM